ncbi:MAG: 30S ribosomal protein S2 [Patescibacteria group bacterium]
MIEKGANKNTFIDDMLLAGSHFGYSKSRRHPSMKSFILGAKNRVELFNLDKTLKALDVVKEFIASKAQDGKTILFVGTKPEAKKTVEEYARAINMPYVTERWIGGMLTNFHEIKKRVARLEEIQNKKEKGELAKYTKKEQLLLDRELAKLNKNFSGIVSMKELPKALFVVDPKHEQIAVTEARKENIPVIALASSDCDISKIDYSIPVNESSRPSIELLVREIASAYREGALRQPIPPPAQETPVSNGQEDAKKELITG